jgi:hypothetical protein
MAELRQDRGRSVQERRQGPQGRQQEEGAEVRQQTELQRQQGQLHGPGLQLQVLQVRTVQVHLRSTLRSLLTALALLGIAAIAQGCGGGDSETTDTSAAAEPTTALESGQGTGKGSEANAGNGATQAKGPGEGGNGGGSSSDTGPSGPGLSEKAKPDTKGFKAPPGGDNSIQTYGEEAESSEEEEITTAMASFLRAMAARDYPAICEGLSEANRGQLEQLAKLKKEIGTDCPSILKSLLVGPTDEAKKAAEGTVYQVRVEGDNAFVMFTPLGGTASYFVMKHDPDGWKSTTLSPGVPFNPTAG